MRERLTPVELPQAERAAESIRERLHAQHASLLAVQQAGADDAKLGAAYGEVGKLLLSAEYLTEAEPYLQNARLLAPGEMRWPYYLAQLHRQQQQPEQAIALLEQALALQPDYLPALIALGNLSIDAGKTDAAKTAFERVLARQPRSAAARFGLGRVALGDGDYAGAVAHLDEALAADPQAAGVHYSLAMAHRGLGDARQAEAHLRQWQDREIRVDDPLMQEIGDLLRTAIDFEVRGTRAVDRGRFADAAGEFRRGLALAPRDPSLHLNLGTALFLGGDEAGALAEFEEAVRLSPGYAKAHFTLGVLHEGQGRDAIAVDRFAAAVQHDPMFVDARFALANGLRRTGQAGASLAHYQAIVAADPGASQARLGYALGLVQLGRYREARASLADAVATYPDQAGFAHALARVLAAAPDDGTRDGAQALRIMQQLVTQVRSVAVEETMAMALAEVGRFAEAAEWQRTAIARARGERKEDLAPRLTDNLRAYEAGTACRMPWRTDDAVFRPMAGGIPG